MKALLRVTSLLAASLAVFSAYGQGANPPTTTPPDPAANNAPLTADQKTTVLKGIEDILTQRAFVPGVDFSKWTDAVATKKDDLDKAETVGAFTSVINRALRDFGLSHIRLLSPRSAAARGRTTSVGIGIQSGADAEGLKVRGVVDTGPAKTAGIEVGDVITKVNGKKPESSEELQGERGAKLQIELKKATGDLKNVEVELKEYSTVRKETLTWATDDTAVLKIYTFSNGYDRANIEGLVKEANTKAKNLILDLRSNGGGAVNNLNHLLSLLMPDGTEYGTFVSRRLYDDYVKANPDKEKTIEAVAEWAKERRVKTRAREGVTPFAGKIAVLLNRGSASASEITAAALKESRDAKFIGQRSAGAVLASTFQRLPEGFSIQIPMSDYITVKGKRLEKNPCVPDEEVTGQVVDGKDPVIEKAIEILMKN